MELPIRARLAIVCAALVGALVLGLGTLVYLRLEADLRAAADDGLLPRATAVVEEPPSGPTLAIDPSDVGDIFSQVLARDGTVLATTPGLAPGPVVPTTGLGALDGPRYFDSVVHLTDEPLVTRVLEMPTADDRVVVVGVAFDDQREALDRLLVLLGLAGLVAILLAGAVGWVVAGAALRPVERMRIEVDAVSGSEPGRRLRLPRGRDELAALGVSLNRMLHRLEAAVERERRFVADASHELRTPLANLKAELDLALHRARSPSELVEALRSASEETDRLSQLAEDLLLLASADGGPLPIRLEDVDVSSLVRETVGSFEGRAKSLGLVLEASVEGATGILLNVTGGSDIGLFEVNEAAEVVTGAADQNANVIFGAVIDESLEDEVRVTVIATGFGPHRTRRRRPAQVAEPEQLPGEEPQPARREGFDVPDDVLEVPSFLRDS